jgi:hypothetical protein
MYFPKNKIKTNLYTTGREFVYVDDNFPFTGYYYSLYNGKYFEGKSPTKGNREIIPVSTLPEGENTGNQPDYIVDSGDKKLAYIIETNQTQILPLPFYPQPTEKDYTTGQFRRYFCKKVNENIFLEINKTDYNALFNKDSNYVFSLYTPLYLYWYLTGDKDQVATINKRVTLQAQNLLQLPGLSKFVESIGGYLKFYK